MKFPYPPPIDYMDFPEPQVDDEDEPSSERSVQRSGRDAKHSNTLDRDTCGILELYLKSGKGKKSKSFTATKDQNHKTIGPDTKERFCFVPENPSPTDLPQPNDIQPGGENVTICWKLAHPKRIASARLELFRPGRDQPIHVVKLAWKQGKLKAASDADEEDTAGAGDRESIGEMTWNGCFDPADADARSCFPNGCVTVAFSPYKLRMVVEPVSGTQCTCATGWTYFDVLVESIELEWGDEKVIPRDRPDIGGETVVHPSRTDLTPITKNQWLDKALQNTKAILQRLKQETKPGRFDKDHEVVLHSPTCITHIDHNAKDAMFRAYRNMWGEGPLLPIFARVRLLDSRGKAVDAPWALAKTDFLWDWEDDDKPGKKADLWTDKEQKRSIDFVRRALNFLVNDEAISGYAPEGSNNCHRLHGGKRGHGAKPIFPPQTPDPAAYDAQTTTLTDYKFPFAVRATDRRKWAALSQARISGVLAGRTGVLFQPSRMAGDTYQVSVYLAVDPNFPYLAKGSELRKDKKMQLPKASSGKFVTWRKIPLKFFKKDPRNELQVDLTDVKKIYQAAGVHLEIASVQPLTAIDWDTAFSKANEMMALSKGKHSLLDKYRTAFHALPASQAQGPYMMEVRDESDLQVLYDDAVGKGVWKLEIDMAKMCHDYFALPCLSPLENTTRNTQGRVIMVDVRNPNSVSAVVQAANGSFKDGDQVRSEWTQAAGTVARVQALDKPGLIALNAAQKLDSDLEGLSKQVATVAMRAYIDAKHPNEDFLSLFLFKDTFSRTSSTLVTQGGASSAEQTELRGVAYATFHPARAAKAKGEVKSTTAVCAHELGHSLFLAHMKGRGGTGAQDHQHIVVQNTIKDDDIDYCLMNYHPKSERFCGLCLLRLRGWACSGSKDPDNAAELVPLLSQPEKNEVKELFIDSVTVEIPLTPPRTKRKLPSSDQFNIPKRQSRDFLARTPQLSDNPPLVLVCGSHDGSNSTNTDAAIQAAGAPLCLRANYHVPPEALDCDVVWHIERYRGEGEDGPLITASSPKALPTLTADTNDASKATLLLDAVGTFTIYAAIDPDGTGTFSDKLKQDAVCVNVVLVKASFLGNQHQFSSDSTWAGRRFVGEKGDDMLLTLRPGGSDPAPLWLKTEVQLIGGGPMGMLGLDRVRAGWVNNVCHESSGAKYRNDSGADAWEIQTLALHRPGASAPYAPLNPANSSTAPLLDKGGGASVDNWSADKSVLNEAKPPPTTPLDTWGAPVSPGRKGWIEVGDAPEQGWDIIPPVKKGDPAHFRMQHLWLALEFRAHLCFWTTDAPGLVGVLAAVEWKMDGAYNVSDTKATTALPGRDLAVTCVSEQHYPSLVPGVSTNLELWPPTHKTSYTPRNLDPSHLPCGTSFKEGKPN